jgi:hypothetical protein
LPTLQELKDSIMSTVFEKLIGKYAERGDFERLKRYQAERLAWLESIRNGTYEKMHLVTDNDPVPLVAEIERELACIAAALKQQN